MASSPERLIVHTHHDLVCVVPYLLGFHPTSSLVAVGLSGTSVALTARSDLPTDTRDITRLVTTLAERLRRNRITNAVLISYSGPEPLPTLGEAIDTTFAAAGIQVTALLRVAAGRYFCYCCTDATCSGDGTAIRPETSLLPAQAIVAGVAPMPDRASVAAQLDPVDADRAEMGEATRRVLQRLATLVALPDAGTTDPETGPETDPGTDPVRLARRLLSTRSATHSADLTRSRRALLAAAFDAYHTGATLDDDDAATLVVLLTHPPFRDLALGVTRGDTHHQMLWIDLTRRALPGVAAAPAALAAYAAWRAGNGALAACAVERALADDPNQSLALLVAEALRLAVPPSVAQNLDTPHQPQ